MLGERWRYKAVLDAPNIFLSENNKQKYFLSSRNFDYWPVLNPGCISVHCSHEYSHSSLLFFGIFFGIFFDLMWRVKSLFVLNLAEHSVHLKFFSFTWRSMWTFRQRFALNAISHNVHVKGRASVCTTMCCCRKAWRWIALSHCEHWYGFSFSWTSLWYCR